MKTNLWKDLLKPVVVLTVICIVTSGALAFTNSITLPIIEANALRAENEIRFALLPEADGFEQVEYSGTGVVSVYSATNGAGYIITGVAKGYGGPVPVVVAFGPNGTIIATSITGTSETPGLGKKVEEAAFQSQLWGLAAEPITLGEQLIPIAGVTISGHAVTDAVNNAITAYKAVHHGIVEVELTEIELAAVLLNEDAVTEVQPGIYKGETGFAFATSGIGYEDQPVYCLVAIDNEGVIVGLSVDASTQTPGPGTRVEKPLLIDQYIGVTAGDEPITLAGSTFSSQGVAAAVAQAFAAFATVKGE